MSEQFSILVVDDEPGVCLALEGVLSRQGYRVTTALSATAALKHLEKQPVDLALLDLNMVGMDGLHLLDQIKRQWPDTVVMILTGYGTLQTALVALRQGAHDYLLKPSSPQDIIASVQRGLQKQSEERRRQQLLSRIEADLAELRSGMPQALVTPEAAPKEATEEMPQVIQAGPVILDLRRHVALFEGVPLSLTPIEFQTLASLVRRRGEVVRCVTLVKEAQGHECSEREARILVKAHISHLRQKMRLVSSNVDPIINMRGVGYMFVAGEQEET